MVQKNSYNREELLACGRGEMFGENNAQLPLPNMLMIDRVSLINSDGGARGKGEIHAELDITEDLWFFCLLYTSPSPRDRTRSRMPSSA